MYCKRCGSGKHFATDCDAGSITVASKLYSAPWKNNPLSVNMDGKGTVVYREESRACPECGSTPEIFSEAKKWRTQRDKRKRYMQEYRRK